MRRREFKHAGIGGLDLQARAWLPEDEPRAVVVLAHGLGEHSGRYDWVGNALVARHYALYAIDHRGHGRSAGPRANIGRFDHVVSDFATFAGRAAKQHPGRPLFLLGHSMGGAVAFVSALRLQQAIQGLVLSAPALAVDEKAVTSWQRAFAAVLSAVAPNVGVLRLDATAVSRDPQVVQEYESDPLVHHGGIPARTVVELLSAVRGLATVAPKLQLPTLILHGMADRLVPLAPTLAVHRAIGSARRTLKLYPGLYHELFNEPERGQVMSDLLGWLDAR
jgi:alpha-beta hydrolase superfamily lysophospholipase